MPYGYRGRMLMARKRVLRGILAALVMLLASAGCEDGRPPRAERTVVLHVTGMKKSRSGAL